MKKRKRDREATTELIKKTSLEVFSKNGFDNATTKTIAEKCHVAESLIIKYFKNKNGLLNSITEDFIQAITAAKQNLNYEAQESLEKELQNYTLNTFELVLDSQKVIRIIVGKSVTDQTFSKSLKKLIPPPEVANLLIKERVDELIRQKKAPQSLDAVMIDQAITFHVFGYYLIGAPLFGFTDNEVRDALKEWALDYGRGLKLRK